MHGWGPLPCPLPPAMAASPGHGAGGAQGRLVTYCVMLISPTTSLSFILFSQRTLMRFFTTKNLLITHF